MKRTILLGLLQLVFIFFSFGQNNDYSVILDLSEMGQYLNAINELNDLKSVSDEPQLIDVKVQLTIEGFVQSLNHKLFAFTNLGEDDDIFELRRKGGEFTMVVGDLGEEVEDYVTRFPDSFYVYKAAGDYYSDVLLRYSDQLEAYSYSDLYKLITGNYKKAYSLGCSDIDLIAGLAINYLRMGDYGNSVKFYKLAVEKEPQNAGFHYNLSIGYQNLSEYENAMIHSNVAIEKYDNANYKADSYHINGFQNKSLNRMDPAKEMYEKALELNPDLFYSQSDLIDLLLSENRIAEAEGYIESFFIRNVNDFSKFQKLIVLYFNYKEIDAVYDVLSRMAISTENNIHKGTFYYHLAVIENSTERNPRENLMNARESYLKELSEDEGIIKHIDDFLNNIDS